MLFSYLDIAAFSWFVFCWLGYSVLINLCKNKSGNIHGLMHGYRLNWMEHALQRSDQTVDVVSLGNLMRAVAFFASTSILIVAALIPLLGYGDKASVFIASLPYTITNPAPIWEIKTLSLIVIFTYAFFKYTWALRQYHYATIIFLSSEYHIKNKENIKDIVSRNANILSNAARHFSMGIRSYYYAIAVLSWYLHPLLFMISTTLVVIIIFRREFMSKALDILSHK